MFEYPCWVVDVLLIHFVVGEQVNNLSVRLPQHLLRAGHFPKCFANTKLILIPNL